ncbi:MAG TPA: FIST N-terminal domain-containing protein [Methylophilaceae bacterium]|nr:FIST N-terminal domain-containing protein [Methylophilaceae bacterium]
MLIKQEAVTGKLGLKDLPKSSPLPSANLVLVFGSVRRFSDPKLAEALGDRYPAAQVIGCTTAGEINEQGVFDDSLQITAIQWERTSMRVTDLRISGMQNSFQAGASIATTLQADSLRAVLVFSDGLNVNGTDILKGMQSVLGNDIPIVGGMAGDNAAFTRTLLLHNETVSDNLVIAIGLYGNNLITASGALGGWKPYGPPRKVTRSVKNVVHEMDGKPALPLYRMYIGEHYAKGLPGSGLKFPFAFVAEGGRDVETIRTLLSIDPANNSLTFAGDVPEGQTVRFCQTTHDRLVEGAGGAAHMVSISLPEQATRSPGLAVCVSCVGRKLVMADQVSDEIRIVKNVLGSQAAITGFYSNGEFCPSQNSDQSVLHNQTMTIGYLTEDMYA